MILKKLLLWLTPSLLIICLLLIGCLWLIRRQLQDDSIPVADKLDAQKVMFIFPHPDDEITCAGTLKQLQNQGVETILISLTHGEAGPTSGLITESEPITKKNKLAQIRRQELISVVSLLGIKYLEMLDFPDGGIKDIAPEKIKKVIEEKIKKYQPNIVISYDDKIGLYGHPDHYLVARYLKQIVQQQIHNPSFPVKHLYQVTLPQPMIKTALKISQTFRENYPSESNQGLPKPDIAFKITRWGSFKRQALELHRSQKDMLGDMQPYYDKFPPFIYFSVFDKEYFAQVDLKKYIQ